MRPALQKLFSGLKIAYGTMRARKSFIHNGHTVQLGTMGAHGLAAAQATRTTSALFHTTSRRHCARKHILTEVKEVNFAYNPYLCSQFVPAHPLA